MIIPLIGLHAMNDKPEGKDLTPEQVEALQNIRDPQQLTEYQARVLAAVQRQQPHNHDRSETQEHAR